MEETKDKLPHTQRNVAARISNAKYQFSGQAKGAEGNKSINLNIYFVLQLDRAKEVGSEKWEAT